MINNEVHRLFKRKLTTICESNTFPLCFTIGMRSRDGFLPGLSVMDYHLVTKNLDGLQSYQRYEASGDHIDIGPWRGYWITSSTGFTLQKDICSTLICDNYLIQFLPANVIQVVLLQNCNGVEPFKHLSSLFPEPFTRMNLPNLFPSQWDSFRCDKVYQCLPIQKLKFNYKTFVVEYPHQADIVTMVVKDNLIYLTRGKKIVRLYFKLLDHTGITIVQGYWLKGYFTMCRPLVVKNCDISTRKLSYGFGLAKRALLSFPYAKRPALYFPSQKVQITLMTRHNALLYIPQKKPNSPLGLYQTPGRLRFFFSVRPKQGLYELVDSKYKDFKGTKDYPYSDSIPMASHDRHILSQAPSSTVWELHWEDNNLVPYQVSQNLWLEHNESKWARLHTIQDLFKNTGMTCKMSAEQRYKPLRRTDVNKSVVFYSPLEGEDVLVRTGTIAEGSCFFHALLHAFSRDYVKMDHKERKKFVKRLRASMAGAVTKEKWKGMNGGVIARVPFQENIYSICAEIYTYLTKDKSKGGRSTRRVLKKLKGRGSRLAGVYRVVPELLTFSELTETCLPRVYRKTQHDSISRVTKVLQQEVRDNLTDCPALQKISKSRRNSILKKVDLLFAEIVAEAENSAYRAYKKGLENVSEEIGLSTVAFISNRFDRDVYFMDGKTRQAYNVCPTPATIKNRKSVVVLWVDGNHYEIVGRLLPGNRIQREFLPGDELIRRIRESSYKSRDTCRASSDPIPTRHRRAHPSYKSPSPARSDQYYDSSSSSGEETE